MTDAQVNQMRPSIPDMADGAIALIVQTSMFYVPVYRAGISDMNFDDFIITRPRFAGQLCYNSANTNPDSTTAVC